MKRKGIPNHKLLYIYIFSEEYGSVHDGSSMWMLSKEGLIRKQLIYLSIDPQLFHEHCGRQSMTEEDDEAMNQKSVGCLIYFTNIADLAMASSSCWSIIKRLF